MATSPLRSRGSPLLQSGEQNQKWHTCGQNCYITPAVSGIPTASERGPKSEGAHLWANWPRHRCPLGDPQCFRAGDKITSGPFCGQRGCVSPAVPGIPTAAERGAKSQVAHLWAKWLPHPCRVGDLHLFRAGGKMRSGPLLRHPCLLRDPHRFRAGKTIRSGTLGGNVATSPPPSPGSRPLQSGEQNQKWHTCGQSGYVTPDMSGIPTASEREAKSEVAHLWAKWLRQPCHLGHAHWFRAGSKMRSGPLGARLLRHSCRLGDPHRFRAGGKIRSGPLVGRVATSPLPSRGAVGIPETAGLT